MLVSEGFHIKRAEKMMLVGSSTPWRVQLLARSDALTWLLPWTSGGTSGRQPRDLWIYAQIARSFGRLGLGFIQKTLVLRSPVLHCTDQGVSLGPLGIIRKGLLVQ